MDNPQGRFTSEELSMPASKGDIVRVHGRLDDMASTITALSSAVAVLSARPTYMQPCQFFNAHVLEHKEMISTWRTAIISGFVGILGTGIIGLLGFYIGHLNKA